MTRYLYERILEEVKLLLNKVGFEDAEVEEPPKHIDAFLSVPCFKLAKRMKRPPQRIALDMAERINANLKKSKYISSAEAVAGYINFFPNWERVASEVIREVNDAGEFYGSNELGRNKRVVVDMSSPNIAKPMLVSHLRSTIIGDAISRIYSFLGYDVIKDNHLGDWGTQFGKLLYAFKSWGKKELVKKKGTEYLLELYVRFHREAEKNPDLEQKAREEFARLERGDEENKKLWKWFVEISKREFKEIYDALGVEFDHWLGESFYVDMCDEVVEQALKKGLAEVGKEGEVVVKLEKYGLPNLLIRKSDESTLYATRDLATIKYRVAKFKPHRIIYVVGSEQKLYFRQIFKTAELLGYCKTDMLEHVDFGLMKLPEGKLSTRKGRAILLQEVLQKTGKKSLEIVTEKNPKLRNKENVAKKVAVAAIKFADLSQNRVKDFLFDWDKFVSFEGDTGPYLQYTYARARSILRKAEEGGIKAKMEAEPGSMLGEDIELKIIEALIKFPAVIIDAAKHSEPHRIAEYLLELAHRFNAFYQSVPVLKAETDVRSSRLLLVKQVAQVIKNGLTLLGIPVVDEM